MSIILQQSRPDTLGHDALAMAIGRELRRRRREAHLTQREVGDPFTRAFVCAVERGRALPSIAALAILLQRLDVRLDEFFSGVQEDMTIKYTAAHGHRQKASSRRRR
jgi:transcriptional regulator with XRE-family HTH domain